MTKLCRRCNTVKPLTEFYRGKVGPKTAKNGYHARCKDCTKALAKEWHERNPPDLARKREILRAFRERNPGKDAEYGRKWREKNPERALELARARGRTWRRTKPERKIASQTRRRVREATISRTDEDYIAILRGDPCSYCGSHGRVVDHIEPLHHDGSAGWENLTAACSRCNGSKGTDSLLSFLLRAAGRS